MSVVAILADLPISLTPKSTELPGGKVAQSFVDGIGFYAVLFTLVGLVLSAGLWAVGAFSNNYTQSVNGKKGFLICAGAALAIGAASILINFFYSAGTKACEGTSNANASC